MNPGIQVAVVMAVVALYYMAVWAIWGRDLKPGTIVTQYNPPRSMSPALMRYCWKQRFDERVVWAGVMSLVSHGLVILETREAASVVRPVLPPRRKLSLPREEAALYSELTEKGKRGVKLSLTEDGLGKAAIRMAVALKHSESGLWFVENRNTVWAGAALSAVGRCW